MWIWYEKMLSIDLIQVCKRKQTKALNDSKKKKKS